MMDRRFGLCRLAVTAAAICLAATAGCIRADIVIVQKVEDGSQATEMTMKIKGDKARADISPAVSTIIDASTGDVTTLMHGRKTFMRVTAAAAQELAIKMKQEEAENGRPSPAPPQLRPTGKKEKIMDYEALEFVWEVGGVKLTYWIAQDYPHAAEILAIMKKMQAGAASLGSGFMPDPAEFPGLPVKTEISVNGKKMTATTLVSVKEEPVDAAVFNIPPDYKEVPSPSIPPPRHETPLPQEPHK